MTAARLAHPIDGEHYWIEFTAISPDLILAKFEADRAGHGASVWYPASEGGWFNHAEDVRIVRHVPRPRK